MLDNFSSLIQSTYADIDQSLLAELHQRQSYKSQDCSPFLSDMVRFALLFFSHFLPSIPHFLQKFPLLSFSVMAKLNRGNLNALKVLH